MKKIKIPGIFRKQYKEKTFEKKILKRIHIPEDRKIVSSVFTKNDKGKLVLKSDVSDDIKKKLKSLAKSIKKNRGFVTAWKAAIVAVFAAAVLIFNFVFKDKLIKQFLESGLESVFESQVDVENPRLSIFKGSFIFESLTIADSDKPMYNLIETGRAELNIKMSQLAFKRVHLEEVSLYGVRWNTLRSTDGSLPADQNGEPVGEEADDSGSLAIPSLNPEDFDYRSILESHKNDLQTLKLIESSNEQINNMTSRWTGILDEKEKEIKSLSTKVDSLKSMNISNVQSAESAQDLIQQVQSFYPEVEALQDSVKNLNSDFYAEKKQIQDLSSSVGNSIESDLAYLGDTLDFSMGDVKSLASDLAEDYIRERWNSYYEYGLKALDIYRRFQNPEKKEKKDKKAIARSPGRNILFPSPDSPSFLITHAGISGGDEQSGSLIMNVTSISSEPDKIENPVQLDISFSKEEKVFKLDGYIDMRSDSVSVFEMNIDAPDNHFRLDRGIPALSISSISSSAEISGKSSALRGDSSLFTELNVNLKNIAVDQSDSSGFLSDTIGNLFRTNNSLQLTGEIEVSSDGVESVAVKTDFDRIIHNSVGEYLSDLEGTITRELKADLLSYINPQLENNEILASSLDALGVDSLEQISSVNRIEALLDEKISELEGQADAVIAGIKAEAEAQVKEEAGKVLEDSIGKIKLPGF